MSIRTSLSLPQLTSEASEPNNDEIDSPMAICVQRRRRRCVRRGRVDG